MPRQNSARVCHLFPEPALVVDSKGIVLAASRGVEVRLGLRRDAVVGKMLLDHLDDGSGTEIQSYLAVCSRSGEFVPGPRIVLGTGGDAVRCSCEGGRISDLNEEALILLRLRPEAGSGAAADDLHDRVCKLSMDLEESRRVEQSLAQQKQWLEVTLASIGDAVIITDAEGRASFLNPVAESLTGWKSAEAAGLPLEHIFRIVNEYTRATVENPVARVIRDGMVVGLANHTILIARDGTERPIDDCAAPIKNRHGELGGVVLVCRDVTQRSRADKRLAAQHAVTRILAESPSLHGAAFRILEAIGASLQWDFAALWGLEIETQTLHCVETWCAAPAQVTAFDVMTRQLVLARGVGLPGQVWASGEPIWISDISQDLVLPRATIAVQSGYRAGMCFPIRLNGDILGVIEIFNRRIQQPDEDLLAMMQSIGGQIGQFIERRRAEEELAQAQQQLANTERFSLIMAAQIGLDGRWLKVPPRLCEVLGYTQEELLARTFQDITHPDDVQANWETCQRLFRGEVKSVEYEKRYIRKDGTILSVYLNSSMVFDHEGRPDRMLTYVRDITEQKRVEEHLRQSQKMEAVGRLAGGVAHDFNNMLTIINGYCDLTLQDLQPFDPIHENIVEIRKAAERAALLTRQLLAFSRKQIVAPKPLNINAIVTESKKMLQRLIGEDVETKIVFDPALGDVKADSGQVEQIIVNLVINARDAMPQGGRLIIETRNVDVDDQGLPDSPDLAPGRYVLLAISDTGQGMDAQTLAHVFEPFFTTKQQGQGTGLGLATVYGIVQQSGGRILVTSQPGMGATFRIYLPRIDAAGSRPEEAKVSMPDGGTETILLVEDEDMVRTLTSRMLRGSGYTVLEACNGGEGLLTCEQHQGPIHLILTDVVMPKMSGRELAERLRSLRPDLKVIFMSGYTDDVVLRHGALSMDARFIQKPFTSRELIAKVRAVLDA